MFGERHPSEEVALEGFFSFRSRHADGSGTREAPTEGGWRRVPANDNVAIVRGMRATVEVTEDGKPINDAEARLLKLQNAEAERHKRNVDEDYTVVYIPPFFKYRVFIFILAVWSVCCVAIAAMLAGPVLLGRRFFLLFTAREVHDGYSFLLGFHLLWGCWLVAQAVERLDRHRQRREHGSRAWWPLFLAKRSSLWLAQASYMAIFLVFVIPTLIALVMEVYVLLPVKLIYDPRMVVRVKLVEMWVLGLFYTKIILRLPGFEAPRQMNDGIQRVSVIFLMFDSLANGILDRRLTAMVGVVRIP
jgi:E3 ubiquitin-protein ligase MARCH6